MAVYTRQFPSTFEMDVEGDGRTVLGRIVPYNEVISYVDPWDEFKVKKEMFVPGAFGRQGRPGAWSNVLLSFQHDEGFENTIGYGRELHDREDGAYATFRLYKQDADKVAEMVQSSHKGLSVEFEPLGREHTNSDGVVIRDNVRARRVGITGDPAYRGAKVLAVRERDEALLDELSDRVPTPLLDEVRAELARLREGPVS